MRDSFPANQVYTIYSHSKQRANPAMYTGTGGNILLYFRLYEYLRRRNIQEESRKARAEAELALTTNLMVLAEC